MPRRPLLALLLITGLSAQAQTLPDYTFGPAFGNGFNSGRPGLYAGGRGPQTPMWPGAAYNAGQAPFLSMPMPGYPTGLPAGVYGNNATPPTGLHPQAQPLPYWMQTPQSPLPPARFANPVSAPTGSATPARPQTFPPRWVPLSGPLPVVRNRTQGGNSWRAAPINTAPGSAQRPSAAPPKWHTE